MRACIQVAKYWYRGAGYWTQNGEHASEYFSIAALNSAVAEILLSDRAKIEVLEIRIVVFSD